MDGRKKLLKLIDDLNFPMMPEEAKEHVEKLSDEEVDKLILLYTDIKKYQRAIEKVAREADPKEYIKTEEEYENKMAKIDEDYEKEMEAIQKKQDDEFDRIEAEVLKKTDEAIGKQNEDLDEIEKAHSDLYSKLNIAVKK
jgi:hypothetical protein